MIVGFLHFYKTKWQSVYEQSNVRTKFVLSVLTGKFGCEMKRIIPNVIKVNQLYRRYGFQTIIKATTEIIIIQFFTNIFQDLKIFTLMLGIQSFELLLKRQQNICVTVIDCAIFIFPQLTKVSISYSSKMNHCRHLYPCSLRELLHVTYPFYRLSNLLNPLVVSLQSVAKSLN